MRELLSVLICSALDSVGGLGNHAPVFDHGVIAGPVPTPSVGDRVLVILSDLLQSLKILEYSCYVIAAGFLVVDIGLDCI